MAGRLKPCCCCGLCLSSFDIKLTVSGVDAALCSGCVSVGGNWEVTTILLVDGVYIMHRTTDDSRPCTYTHEVTQVGVAQRKIYNNSGCSSGLLSTTDYDDIAIILIVQESVFTRLRIGVGDTNPNSNIVFNEEDVGTHLCLKDPIVVDNAAICNGSPRSSGGTITIERA